MKDGDAQQQNEIHHAMKNVFVSATDGNCGFHIGTLIFIYMYFILIRYIIELILFSVHMGYLKHVPGIQSVKVHNQARWSSVVKKNSSVDK